MTVNPELVAKKSWGYGAFLIIGMLMSGTAATILRKITFLMEARGLHDDEHAFAKPWFGTLEMFLGELLVLPLFLGKLYYMRRHPATASHGQQQSEKGKLLSDTWEHASPVKKPSPPTWHLFVLMGTATCDLAGTTLASIGLLFIPASVYQILRGSVILFTAIFNYFVLGQRVSRAKKAGIAIVFLGLAMVGVSAVLASGGSSGDTKMLLIGFLLVICGQACNGLQFSIQERLIERNNVDPLAIVGWEGLYGTVLMSFLVLPILQNIPGEDVGGKAENTEDTLVMLGNSAPLLVLNMIIYPLLISGLNGFALLITEYLNALYRCLIDATRVILVWVVSIIIFYSGAPEYGEKWTVFSWLQLAGFAVFLFGMFVYRELIPFVNRLLRVGQYATLQ
eukprot:ANDGO_01067.mRNA.1 Uncharacterized protein C12G12.12